MEKIIAMDPASKDGDKCIEATGYMKDGKLTITSLKEIKPKHIRIRSSEEMEEQIETLKKFYKVKSKSGAIKKAVRDTAMVASHKDLNKMITIDEPDLGNWSDIKKIDVGHNIDGYGSDLGIEFKSGEYEGYSLKNNGK